jgi:hypothetical protein
VRGSRLFRMMNGGVTARLFGWVSALSSYLCLLSSSLSDGGKAIMTDSDTKDVVSIHDEKKTEVTREYLRQDESPDAVEARKKEAALVRKLDCYIAPVMMLLMLISYLDRGNIGFAASQGMGDE